MLGEVCVLVRSLSARVRNIQSLVPDAALNVDFWSCGLQRMCSSSPQCHRVFYLHFRFQNAARELCCGSHFENEAYKAKYI